MHVTNAPGTDTETACQGHNATVWPKDLLKKEKEEEDSEDDMSE